MAKAAPPFILQIRKRASNEFLPPRQEAASTYPAAARAAVSPQRGSGGSRGHQQAGWAPGSGVALIAPCGQQGPWSR